MINGMDELRMFTWLWKKIFFVFLLILLNYWGSCGVVFRFILNETRDVLAAVKIHV